MSQAGTLLFISYTLLTVLHQLPETPRCQVSIIAVGYYNNVSYFGFFI